MSGYSDELNEERKRRLDARRAEFNARRFADSERAQQAKEAFVARAEAEHKRCSPGEPFCRERCVERFWEQYDGRR